MILKVLPTYLSLCEDVYYVTKKISIAFGNENIAKWDDFAMKVEFAVTLWLMTGEFIFNSYHCGLGKTIFVKL